MLNTIIHPGVKYDPEIILCVKLMEFCFTAMFPDFFQFDVGNWWGDLHKSLTDIGVAGIWNDMNEPAIRPFGDGGEKICFPLDATHGEVHH
ncbi:MAG TPA: TIM-barrel domain-containing protein [Nodularia sp. (in: cyanobacteria)]|nr:TIM-barrel domain-containing protein [Nodularia sp. (in: cyanobacteria)]